MNHLENAVISTISYFDMFDYPLSLIEIWKWLYFPTGQSGEYALSDIERVLEQSSELTHRIGLKNGLYFLKGRDELVSVRMQRYNIAERKYQRALGIGKWLRLVPSVRMIAICNTLAYSNARDRGDIDLFIICQKGTIWRTRFFVAGFLKLLGIRPKPNNTKDTFCASFFITDDHLDIHELAIQNDVYLVFWTAQIVPVYDDGAYSQFLKANTWIKAYLPNFFPMLPAMRRRLSRATIMRNFLSPLLFIIPERLCKWLQMKILPPHLRELANRDTAVVMNDQILKFHDNDRREAYQHQFMEKLRGVL